MRRGSASFTVRNPGTEANGNTLGLPASIEPLPRSFYEPSADVVAPRLLGHWLLRRTEAGLVGGRIVETEAYLHDDPACHGFRGETARNRAMYGPPGRAYIYFIYGNHWCFNAVCNAPGRAEAVLVRAIDPQFGMEWMNSRRRVKRPQDLTNGPAKFCEAMDIDRRLDHVDLCRTDGELFIARNPEQAQFALEQGPVVATPRIGISQAADLPLRFILPASLWLSRPLNRRRNPGPTA